MTKYEELIQELKNIDLNKAEYMEEEIDIIIHKLKFLPSENLPKAIVLEQSNDFLPLQSSVVDEKIKIAGGKPLTDMMENPDSILIIQNDDSLYSHLPSILNSPAIANSSAVSNNNIYIIQNANFNQTDEQYLKDTEILAEILQPKYFFFGHDGKDWVKFDIQ